MMKQVTNNFTLEEEELLRSYIFTNPHEDTSFIFPDQVLIVGEELPPLISAYSRTHLPMQARILQFLDKVKSDQTRAVLPHIKPLMDVLRMPDGTMKVSRRTQNFHKEYVLGHGHSSIKEEANLVGFCEHTSDFISDIICGDPLNRPQRKSTRYLSWNTANLVSELNNDLDLWSGHDYSMELEALVHGMMRRYTQVTDQLADMVSGSEFAAKTIEYMSRPENIIKAVGKFASKKQRIEGVLPTQEELDAEKARIEKNLKNPEWARKEANTFVLDYSRVYLTAAVPTSTGFSADIRTLERMITRLISSPSIEARQRGEALWREAKKVAPILLGEKGHIRLDQAGLEADQRMRELVESKFKDTPPQRYARPQVTLVAPPAINIASDRFNAACAIFPYTNLSIETIYHSLDENEVGRVLDISSSSDERNPLHPSIHHNGLSVQPIMAHHAYRDIFRHRKGSRSNQPLTTRLGFEVPEIFEILGLKEEYLSDMDRAARLYEKIYPENPVAAQKLTPFGALGRSLHTWDVRQMQYVAQLRGNIVNGNRSYVVMAREMVDELSKIMPLTARQFKFDKENYPADLWKIGYEWYDAEGRK